MLPEQCVENYYVITYIYIYIYIYIYMAIIIYIYNDCYIMMDDGRL